MLTLTDEMELIIPDTEDQLSSPSRSGAGPAVTLKPTTQPPFDGAAPDSPSDDLPLLEVDASSRQPPPTSAPHSDALTFVGGAELLEIPDDASESEEEDSLATLREPAPKRPSSRVHLQDERRRPDRPGGLAR